MNYIVLYDYESYAYIDAENLEDCIIKFADYVGDNTDLFLKALRGCNAPTDYVKMYEHFSSYNINAILLIQHVIYDAEVDKNE